MSVDTLGRLTFGGGVHPVESKELSSDKAIKPGPVAKRLAVMLSQHVGAVCRALVRKGNVVQAGQKIGEADAFISACVHSPINGTVKEISLWSHPVLGRSGAIVIEPLPHLPTKRFRFEVGADFDESGYTGEQICEAAGRAGMVGMGGAGFPTRVKIEPNPRLPKNTLIINGCECEPYITCDYRLMLERTNELLAGVKLARKASGCSRVLIAVEDNKPKAIEAIQAAVHRSNSGDISVVKVKTKYPQGGERQLITAVLNKVVPTGGIPPAIGVLVLNVSTAVAIAEAVVGEINLTHRVVTVTGEAIARPGNLDVAIGTPVSELIEFCGGVTKKSARVVLGGPMMGIAIADLSTPVLKTTNAVTVLTGRETEKSKLAGGETPCIRCGKCLEVCPEGLNPTKIAHAVKNNMMELAGSYYITACIECGSCSYVCPANIDLSGHIKTGKLVLAKRKKKIPQ